MALIYYCRHCGVEVGKIDELSIDIEQLGLHLLTDKERHEMIVYDSTGNIHIKSICEDCHESFTKNPTLHQYDYLIH